MKKEHVVMSIRNKNKFDNLSTDNSLSFVERYRHHDFITALKKLEIYKKRTPSIRFTIITEYIL